MNRRIHRILALVLTLPFFAWAVTGIFFHLKPGYAAAYAMPRVKTYPLGELPALTPQPSWHRIQWTRTVLGLHLLVEADGKKRHLDPATGEDWTPDLAQIERLVVDALAEDPVIGGKVIEVALDRVTLDNGRTVQVHWQNLGLSQKGRDTRFINWMYEIHYLRWTGIRSLDQVLAPFGLVLVTVLLVTGLRLWVKSSPLFGGRFR
ncbi:PepSY domain-containing protein [Acanthopleuribacter pedis]|uniref:PepSY domain-containing protein n=1 Tax=Acanthopleuribacter pedis TaxID=442870 RepID=A0A8J7U4J0_9BACT|nr:PepSY domain-containing protein [Acanthopleuribacter pedis]MBO1318351.1 PepSY domain-containing protein [Acanthopleuribacter pedis]